MHIIMMQFLPGRPLPSFSLSMRSQKVWLIGVADTKARFMALVAGISPEEAKRIQFYAGVDL